MAPPSIHPKKGTTYLFHDYPSPHKLEYPSEIPIWLLAIPDANEAIKPKKHPELWRPRNGTPKNVKPEWLPCSPQQVKNAIQDKLDLVARWGIRFPNRHRNEKGWIRCHDFDREDRNPSAAFHPDTGGFWRPGVGVVCLFKLGVEMNIYPDWRAACTDLAHHHLPHLFRTRKNG
jgi:hypothetical protein